MGTKTSVPLLIKIDSNLVSDVPKQKKKVGSNAPMVGYHFMFLTFSVSRGKLPIGSILIQQFKLNTPNKFKFYLNH